MIGDFNNKGKNSKIQKKDFYSPKVNIKFHKYLQIWEFKYKIAIFAKKFLNKCFYVKLLPIMKFSFLGLN